ncbi:MAG: hypothetical protein GY935_20290 [Gammaproteobacteria bacterium]|nr:hypothetical protein [Gammaproteobacteria bacterium]
MKIHTWGPILISFVLLLGGCASTPKMAFLEKPQTELEKGNSIYLLSVDLRNEYKTDYQPKLNYVSLELPDKEKWMNFVLNPEARTESEDPQVGNQYLTHFSLAPGKYVLRHLVSINTGFLIYGSFITPVHEEIEVGEPGIYYLGNVSGLVRQRQGKEFKAGSSIPLIDQATVGASGGSWDIEISDRWIDDQSAFLATYPSLKDATIKSAVMPPFDHPRAQKYWEDH